MARSPLFERMMSTEGRRPDRSIYRPPSNRKNDIGARNNKTKSTDSAKDQFDRFGTPVDPGSLDYKYLRTSPLLMENERNLDSKETFDYGVNVSQSSYGDSESKEVPLNKVHKSTEQIRSLGAKNDELLKSGPLEPRGGLIRLPKDVDLRTQRGRCEGMQKST